MKNLKCKMFVHTCEENHVLLPTSCTEPNHGLWCRAAPGKPAMEMQLSHDLWLPAPVVCAMILSCRKHFASYRFLLTLYLLTSSKITTCSTPTTPPTQALPATDGRVAAPSLLTIYICSKMLWVFPISVSAFHCGLPDLPHGAGY